ncbi:MAG: LapA family protein [Bacillota bacterium]
MQGTIIFGLIFAILIAIFAIQNASIVALNILMWEFQISLAVVVLGSIIFGALVIGIFSYFKQFQLKRKNRNLKLEIQALKEELDDLKVKNKEIEANLVNQISEDEHEQKEQSSKTGFFGRKKKEKKTVEDNDENIAYSSDDNEKDEDNKK